MTDCISSNKASHVNSDPPDFLINPDSVIKVRTGELNVKTDIKSTEADKRQTSSRPVAPEKPSVSDWLLM